MEQGKIMSKIKILFCLITAIMFICGCEDGFASERYASNNIDDGEYDYHQMYVDGDSGDLTDKELEAFNEATRVYNLYIANCKNDFEKVKAAHDYIIKNSTYNKAAIENNTLSDDDFSVYGTLVKKIAVCEGYAKTFQMLMDIADIDCITVTGTVGTEQVAHAWNMVKLGDAWYHVDVTFDDPYPETNEIVYLYFNVTDEIISKDHSWNKNVTPQANADEYDYVKMSGKIIDSESELSQVIDDCSGEMKMYISFVWTEDDMISDSQWREALKDTAITNINYSCLGVEGRRFYMINLTY